MSTITVTTGTLANGWAADGNNVNTVQSALNISVPDQSTLVVFGAAQHASTNGADISGVTFNGNALTQQAYSAAGGVTHGDWNACGWYTWFNNTGSAVAAKVILNTTAVEQRVRFRARVIAGQHIATPLQTITGANTVNQSNGAADPALLPATGSLTGQVDGILFAGGVGFGFSDTAASFAGCTDEFELYQADNNYFGTAYKVLTSTAGVVSWTRGSTNGYKLMGIVFNPLTPGGATTPTAPTITGAAVTSTTATITQTLPVEGRDSVTLQYRTQVGPGAWVPVVGTANQTSFSLTGLTANTVYEAQAKATNAAAAPPDSAWAPASPFVFGTENAAGGGGDVGGSGGGSARAAAATRRRRRLRR